MNYEIKTAVSGKIAKKIRLTFTTQKSLSVLLRIKETVSWHKLFQMQIDLYTWTMPLKIVNLSHYPFVFHHVMSNQPTATGHPATHSLG